LSHKDLSAFGERPARASGCVTLTPVRILVDYRPALRERTGVGEYIHELVRAYAAAHPNEVTVFSSSWRDRPAPGLAVELGVHVLDRRVPVRVLNYGWHRLGWPRAETIAGIFDVVHAAHPLLIPSERAAQVVTIHDLFFLARPEHTRAEIRRDYPALAAAHARQADAIITSTNYGRNLIATQLGAAPDRVYVCPPGAPKWRTLGGAPRTPAAGCILFLGTLEARKNIGTLLDAYALLLERGGEVPRLVLAGRATPDADIWLARIASPPLAGRATHVGYVDSDHREQLYAGATVLALPSLEEGFGLTALEAMSAGVPVVATNRGSLPEVVGAAGLLVDPTDARELADALHKVITDRQYAIDLGRAGLARAAAFTWDGAAQTLYQAYHDAVARRRARTMSSMTPPAGDSR
jgi:glycosyltransferase involved in cell wall biosynthesis